MTNSAQLAGAKKALRAEVAAVLQRVPSTDVAAQSAAITRAVQRLPSFEQARSVSVYVSMPSGEADTWELCRTVLRGGKRLYVPRFSAVRQGDSAAAVAAKPVFRRDMDMLQVRDEQELAHGLVRNKWGIAEPPPDADGAPRADALDARGDGLDLILMPGMLFDRSGGRLGHGKGYYDRYVHRARAFMAHRGHSPLPAIVGLCLREQLRTEGVPMSEEDVPLDTLVTPDETLQFRT